MESVLLPHRKRPIPLNSINTQDRSGRSLLFKYAAKGDLKTCQSLLGSGADPCLVDYAGWSPLHEVCLQGFDDLVELFLVNGANANARGGDGDTPLHDAVGNRHINVVQILLRYGASLDAVNEHNQTPLEFAKRILSEAETKSETQDSEKILTILSDWAKMIPRLTRVEEDGMALLHHAAIEGDVQKIMRLLWYGADINAKDKTGWTPLHDAALNGHSESVKVLLNFGADFDTLSLENQSPLHDACVNGHVECVKLLLQYGATRPDAQFIESLTHQPCKELLLQPEDDFKPYKSSDYVPRKVDIIDIPKKIDVSEEEVDINHSFAWGGLDKKRGPFESSREEKKFLKLLATLEKQDKKKAIKHDSKESYEETPKSEKSSKSSKEDIFADDVDEEKQTEKVEREKSKLDKERKDSNGKAITETKMKKDKRVDNAETKLKRHEILTQKRVNIKRIFLQKETGRTRTVRTCRAFVWRK
jgi:ankyrin repeat protein